MSLHYHSCTQFCGFQYFPEVKCSKKYRLPFDRSRSIQYDRTRSIQYDRSRSIQYDISRSIQYDRSRSNFIILKEWKPRYWQINFSSFKRSRRYKLLGSAIQKNLKRTNITMEGVWDMASFSMKISAIKDLFQLRPKIPTKSDYEEFLIEKEKARKKHLEEEVKAQCIFVAHGWLYLEKIIAVLFDLQQENSYCAYLVLVKYLFFSSKT